MRKKSSRLRNRSFYDLKKKESKSIIDRTMKNKMGGNGLKRRIFCFLGILMTALFLCGCGCGKEPEESYLSINKDGSITQKIVESFAEENYDQEELRTMTEEKIEAYYLASGGKKIELTQLKESDNKITVVLEYDLLESYNAFNQAALFTGNIKDALEAEDSSYFYNVKFINAKDNKEISMADVIADESLSVVIFEENMLYQVSGKLKYVSENVEIVSKKTARLKEGQSGPGYLIY